MACDRGGLLSCGCSGSFLLSLPQAKLRPARSCQSAVSPKWQTVSLHPYIHRARRKVREVGKETRIRGSFRVLCSVPLVWSGFPQGFEGVCLGADSFLTSNLVWSVCQSVDNQYSQTMSSSLLSLSFSLFLNPRFSTCSADKNREKVH